MGMTEETAVAVTLATELTMAWLGNPNTRVSADEVPGFFRAMFDTVTAFDGVAKATPDAVEAATDYTPAVTARKSLGSPDHIISMIDGKPYKALRRHLSGHGLTPDAYRARYGLKADYPMVAPAYSEARRAMAKKIGLGRKPAQKVAKNGAASPAPKARSVPAARGRPRKAGA
jgi:predicted transcriptional regulator